MGCLCLSPTYRIYVYECLSPQNSTSCLLLLNLLRVLPCVVRFSPGSFLLLQRRQSYLTWSPEENHRPSERDRKKENMRGKWKDLKSYQQCSAALHEASILMSHTVAAASKCCFIVRGVKAAVFTAEKVQCRICPSHANIWVENRQCISSSQKCEQVDVENETAREKKKRKKKMRQHLKRGDFFLF